MRTLVRLVFQEPTFDGDYQSTVSVAADSEPVYAAAPELLNAVQFLLSNPDNRISKADVEAANAAVSKAKGE